MKAGRYNIRQLFANKDIHRIVVPEIQRDYVWQEDKVTGLLRSILEDYRQYLECIVPEVGWSDDSGLAEPFKMWYLEQKHSSSIGFIYAYRDSDIEDNYFLIDGQQRLTTLLILLLTLASRNVDIKEKFQKSFLDEGKLRFEYQVREAAHKFLLNFVSYCLNPQGKLKDQTWFYSYYNFDTTISSICDNFDTINDFLENIGIDEMHFFDYTCEHILFWYFDTSISEQGEELYIYMNARGESMQDHENLRANLIGKVTSRSPLPFKTNPHSNDNPKDIWAIEWEEWQDFFWKRRYPEKNENADKGFNEFLACISGLENYINGKKDFLSKSIFDREAAKPQSSLLYNKQLTALQLTQLRKIESYIRGLRYLHEYAPKFSKKYEYNGWIQRAIRDIWDLINIHRTNWFADLGDSNRGDEHNRMVFLWSLFHYLSNIDLGKIMEDVFFRSLRVIWLRYHNYSRSVARIKDSVADLIANGPWHLSVNLSAEEKVKHPYLVMQKENRIRAIESCIWEIEDHTLNLVGKGKSSNSSHLVDYSSFPDLGLLTKIRETFYYLFPKPTSVERYHTIRTLLLFYGPYWKRVSPYHYQNFDFSDWERIIRESDGAAFRMFFNDCVNATGVDILESIFEKKGKEFLSSTQDWEDIADWPDQLRIYALALRNKIWDMGSYMQVWDSQAGLLFAKTHRIYNSGRDGRSAYMSLHDRDYANSTRETMLANLNCAKSAI